MRLPFATLIAALPVCVPLSLQAHPHIFIDTGLEVIVDDQNRVTHVRVSWTYDALYSLLVTEEYQMDSDGDGRLNESETAWLSGFDMQWVEGYNGDLEGSLGGMDLMFSGPVEHGLTMEQGQITTTHLRAVAGTPQLEGTLVLRPFDPTYYTAYDVTRPVTVSGAACAHEVQLPEDDPTLTNLQNELATLDQSLDPADLGYGDVGAKFAQTVVFTCSAS